MDFESDPLSDILGGPSNDNLKSKAGAKFQPKARARLRKESKPTLISNLANATLTEGETDATDFHEQNVLHPPSPLVASTNAECLANLMDASNSIESEKLAQKAEVSHAEFPLSNDHRPSAKDDTDSTDVKLAESNAHEDLQSSFPRLGEAADILPELEHFDNILSQSTTINASSARKFQPKFKRNSQLKKKPPPSGTATNDLPVPSLIGTCNSRDVGNNQEAGDFSFSGDFLTDAGRSNREEAEAFHGSESFDAPDQPDANAGGDGKLMAFDTKHLVEDSTSAIPTEGFVEVSTSKISASPSKYTTSEFQNPEQMENDAVALDLNVTALDDLADSHVISETHNNENTRIRKRKCKVAAGTVRRGVRSTDSEEHPQENQDKNLTTCESNEAAESKMKLRNRRNTRAAEVQENGSEVNGNSIDNVSSDSPMDLDLNVSAGDDYKEEETPCKKKVPKRSKKAAVKNGKTVRRSKKSEEAGKSNEDPPKKKFSHSTRRNKRQVNKVLLESDDIDPKKLMIKDLILRAEVEEWKLSKDPAASKNSLSNERSFTWDDAAASYEEEPFASEQGNPDDGGGANKIDESSIKLNYHSYMNKAPKERWSKHDTEVFYKGIQQFGTDFAMIQQLFPGKTRHQVKLKYKKEERQHPMKVYDALTNRSKDHSHFEIVIERLQQAAAAAAAQAYQNSSGDMESAGITGEEENTTGTNDDENFRAEGEGEEGTDNLGTRSTGSTVKSYQSEDGDPYRSQYKSDDEDYAC